MRRNNGSGGLPVDQLGWYIGPFSFGSSLLVFASISIVLNMEAAPPVLFGSENYKLSSRGQNNKHQHQPE